MQQLDEYRVNLKVRNNLILTAMENAGYKSVNQFCKINKLCPVQIGKLINLNRTPVKPDGSWTGLANRLADALGLFPEDLWTQEQTYFVLPTNQSHFNVTHKNLALMLARHTGELPDECDLDANLLQQDRKRLLAEALDCLTEREAKVLQLRFGIGTDKEHTFQEIAQMFNVTNERVRQIELQALRRLKQPGYINHLKHVEDPMPKVNYEQIKLIHNNAAGKTMDIKDFDKLLSQHDWTYAYADDYNYFTRGEEQRRIIMAYANRDPKLMELFIVWSDFSNQKTDREVFQRLREELLQ